MRYRSKRCLDASIFGSSLKFLKLSSYSRIKQSCWKSCYKKLLFTACISQKRGSPVWNIYPAEMGASYSFWDTHFQQMLDLWFSETSQIFSSFRQLFFHSFQGGPKEKTQKPKKAAHRAFCAFPLLGEKC